MSFARVVSITLVLVAGCIASGNRESAAQSSTDSPARRGFQFTSGDTKLAISLSGRPLADYVFRDEIIRRPYLTNLQVAGVQLTRHHPPRAGIDAADHDTMHPGLWLACGDINGQDFWRNKGTIRHEQFTRAPAVEQNRLRFAASNSLLAADGQTLGQLTLDYALAEHPTGCLIECVATFRSDTRDLIFGDQEEMGFGARLTTPLVEKNGGRITTSHGAQAAKEAWGKQADWCDYSGPLDGRHAGIALFADPANPRRSWWHTRDYGLMVANPFGQRSVAAGQPAKLTLPRGQSLRLRFAALLHLTDSPAQVDLPAVYQAFRQSPGE